MARFKDVVIRTKDQLNHMGELGSILKTIGTPNCILNMPDDDEKIPLVYQYAKGKRNGETIDVTPDHIIGWASNISINSNGDLVGDVSIVPVMRLSEHYRGVIDNLLVEKIIPFDDSGNVAEEKAYYNLAQLIVYDKMMTNAIKSDKAGRSMVEKTYNAPTEAYDVSPDVGERLKGTINKMNTELEKATDPSSGWRGKEID